MAAGRAASRGDGFVAPPMRLRLGACRLCDSNLARTRRAAVVHSIASLSTGPHARHQPPHAACRNCRRFQLRVAPGVAQQSAEPAKPAPSFGYDDVVKRARDLAGAPFDAQFPPLPESLAHLDFDAWRDIRFKSDKLLLGQPGGPFRLELFHLGHLYKRPGDGQCPARRYCPRRCPMRPICSTTGTTRSTATLPINLGFAGFRLHYPLNAPHVMDEVIAFLGASYFRFLGRGQRYGLSARGLGDRRGRQRARSFRSFASSGSRRPRPGAERAVVHGLLDGESATGAFRFEIYPGHGHQRRSHRDAVRAPRRFRARHGAAVVDVPGRQERSSLRRRLPHRVARFRTGC